MKKAGFTKKKQKKQQIQLVKNKNPKHLLEA